MANRLGAFIMGVLLSLGLGALGVLAQEAAPAETAPAEAPAQPAAGGEQTAGAAGESASAPASTEGPPAKEPAAAAPGGEEAPNAAGPSTLGIIGAIGLIVGLLGGIGYLIYALEKAWFTNARKVAGELGCPHPPCRTKTLTEDYEVHQWEFNGVSVVLQAGSRVIQSPGSPMGAIAVMGATVTVALAKPLPFQFKIGRPNAVEGLRVKTGDAAFDEELAVVASRDDDARRLLESSALRQAIRDLFQSEASLPTAHGQVSEKEVEVRIFDKKTIRENCVKAAALARALAQKAETLGCYAASPKAPAAAPPAPDASGPTLVAAAVSTRFPSWEVEGPCVFRQEGVYFFVKSLRFAPQQPGAGELLGGSAGQQGALLGAVGSMIGAAVDESLRQAPGRPEGIVFGPVRDISGRLGSALQDAPDIIHCQEFFVLARTDIQKVADEPDGLALMTAQRTFALGGLEAPEKVKGFLAFRGYRV